MRLTDRLSEIWADVDYPFLIHQGRELRFSDINAQPTSISGGMLSEVKPGDVVAIVGDFNPASILTLLHLIDRGTIVVPLTEDTSADHEYFFDSAQVDVVIRDGKVERRDHDATHELIEQLRIKQHPGLVLFSTGSTGRPKAILHDLTHFLKRFETPRPTLRTINFLLFDHIGGLNTLLHTLYNRGVVIAPQERSVEAILKTCRDYQVEVLPTTPTFLRMMLMSGAVPSDVPSCLRIITYGTERMDQTTLSELCRLLPNVDFRQTFGMSELGIVRVKSVARDSLFMRIGGKGVETKVVDDRLHIRSASRMLGYLNAASPFDDDGWYDTKDIVEERDGSYKIVGRVSDVINVGGLKFMGSEVEAVALNYPGVEFARVIARPNPITGEHVEMVVQPASDATVDRAEFLEFMKSRLPPHKSPKRVRLEDVAIGHRFKRL